MRFARLRKTSCSEEGTHERRLCAWALSLELRFQIGLQRRTRSNDAATRFAVPKTSRRRLRGELLLHQRP
jgi:hypothetical protein